MEEKAYRQWGIFMRVSCKFLIFDALFGTF